MTDQHSGFVRPYQICTRCIMDTSDPEIVFDGEGHCNHCTEYFKLAPYYIYNGAQSDAELQRIVAEIKAAGKSSEYDCMIGVSGRSPIPLSASASASGAVEPAACDTRASPATV